MILQSKDLSRQMLDAANDYADKKAAAYALDLTTKTVFSECVRKAKGAGSVAAAEHEARVDPVYVDHLNALSKAQHEAHKAQVKYDSIRVYIELERTNAATYRAEAKLV